MELNNFPEPEKIAPSEMSIGIWEGVLFLDMRRLPFLFEVSKEIVIFFTYSILAFIQILFWYFMLLAVFNYYSSPTNIPFRIQIDLFKELFIFDRTVGKKRLIKNNYTNNVNVNTIP